MSLTAKIVSVRAYTRSRFGRRELVRRHFRSRPRR